MHYQPTASNYFQHPRPRAAINNCNGLFHFFPIPSMLYIPAAFFKPIHKITTVIVAALMICLCILMIEKKDPVMGGNTKHCIDKGAMDLRIEWFCLDKENKL